MMEVVEITNAQTSKRGWSFHALLSSCVLINYLEDLCKFITTKKLQLIFSDKIGEDH